MPQTNAYDYLRQSIAGRGFSTQPTNTSDDDEYLSLEDFLNEPPRPKPPILVVPPGLDLKDFVNQVEQAYGLNYTQEKYLHVDPDDEASQVAHAVDLMDEGLVYLAEANARAASDMFSLCILLAPNYFFHFCLATARYSFGDFEGALKHLRLAMDLIRQGQKLPEDVALTASQVPFADAFYTQLLNCLILCQQMDEAKKMADFVLQKDIMHDPEGLLDVAGHFSMWGEKKYAANFVKLAMPAVQAIEDEQLRGLALQSVAAILTGPDGDAEATTADNAAPSTN